MRGLLGDGPGAKVTDAQFGDDGERVCPCVDLVVHLWGRFQITLNSTCMITALGEFPGNAYCASSVHYYDTAFLARPLYTMMRSLWRPFPGDGAQFRNARMMHCLRR